MHRMTSVQSATTPVEEGIIPLAIVESDSMDAKVNTTIVPMPEATPQEIPQEMQTKYFPAFMIGLSAFQVSIKRCAHSSVESSGFRIYFYCQCRST